MDVSVIIPTYKPGDYIWQCLDSLKGQTLSHDRFETIIIVNGCCEPYYRQIKEYLATWPQTMQTTLVQTDQGGVSNARNMGIDLAKGGYVSFVDDDDWLSANYLEGLLAEAAGNDSLVIANVKNYDENTSSLKDDWLSACYARNVSRSQGVPRPTLLSCRSFLSVACCKLVAREAIGGYRFDTQFKQGEDSLFFFTISHRLHHFGVAAPDVIYFRRLRQSSPSRTRSLSEIFRDNAKLAFAFTKTYVKGIRRYNALFFATRIMACVKAGTRVPSRSASQTSGQCRGMAVQPIDHCRQPDSE